MEVFFDVFFIFYIISPISKQEAIGISRRTYTRSCDYRKTFFQNNKGVFKSGIYQCAYCGKLLKPKALTVDHVIPIHRVKSFGGGRLLMRLKGIRDINDYKNLVAACDRCNKKKSAKMGKWIVKGAIGKHPAFWIFKWSLILAIIIVAAIEIYIHLRGGRPEWLPEFVG